MRLSPCAGALLALLFASPPADRREPAGPTAPPASRPDEVELAVEWVNTPTPATHPAVWRGGFRVANRGGAASGPLQLRVRTPLGLVAERKLTENLACGETLAGTVEVQLVPGLSELCIDVRALDGERTRPEPDTSNNRACRRVSRPDRARAATSATLAPEDTP